MRNTVALLNVPTSLTARSEKRWSHSDRRPESATNIMSEAIERVIGAAGGFLVDQRTDRLMIVGVLQADNGFAWTSWIPRTKRTASPREVALPLANASTNASSLSRDLRSDMCRA